LLISNIEIIVTKYIYIEKFITKLAINDSRSESKLLAKSLLSFELCNLGLPNRHFKNSDFHLNSSYDTFKLNFIQIL